MDDPIGKVDRVRKALKNEPEETEVKKLLTENEAGEESEDDLQNVEKTSWVITLDCEEYFPFSEEMLEIPSGNWYQCREGHWCNKYNLILSILF